MKTVKIIVVAVMALVLGIVVNAQSKKEALKTEKIEVQGNCGMCKDRIEKAAKINGVSKAEWDDESKILTLVYDPAKVSSEDVQKKIAAVGHDTEKIKADDKTYKNLPGCCKYNRKK